MTGWKGEMEWEIGGNFWREGTWVYLWLILVEVRQKTTKFCKALILQLKKIKWPKKKKKRNREAEICHI